MKKVTLMVDSRIRAGKNAGVQVGIIVMEDGQVVGHGMYLNRKCHDPKTGEAFAILKAIELAHAQALGKIEMATSTLEKMPSLPSPANLAERYLRCAIDLARDKGIKVSFSLPTDRAAVDKMLNNWKGPVGYRKLK